MTVTISLSPETEAKLRDQAATCGKDLSTFVSEAIEEKLAATNGAKVVGVEAAADFDQALDDFFAANPEKLAGLPTNFSRADIYADHD